MNNPFVYCTLALLALLNPLSKVFIISTLLEKASREEIRKVAITSTLIAMNILLLFALTGNFLLKYIFHVQIYSFQVVGGVVLFLRGLQALNHGLFFEIDANQKLEETSIVPLSSPMIAGPATITAALSFPAKFGMLPTLVSIVIADFVNILGMLFACNLSQVLKRHNLFGALIRITGLIVATIGAQMVLDGIKEYALTFAH